jgi:hypothetical protein
MRIGSLERVAMADADVKAVGAFAGSLLDDAGEGYEYWGAARRGEVNAGMEFRDMKNRMDPQSEGGTDATGYGKFGRLC